MPTIISIFAILIGLTLRLAVPIAVTALLIILFRKLDARWQAEAGLQPLPVNKPKCWKIKGCTPAQINNCAAYTSPLPCWQVYRLPNGYLREACLTCQVFVNAPLPTLISEPRRM